MKKINLFQRYESGEYYFRYTSKKEGRRVTVSTKEVDKREAEKAARAILAADIDPKKWTALDATKGRQEKPSTLGKIFTNYVLYKGDVKDATAKRNIQGLRNIIRTTRPEHQDKSDAQVDNLCASILTPSLLQDFKRIKTAQAGNDGVKLESLKISANSFRRQALSIFKEEVLPLYKEAGIVLPQSLAEFKKVRPFKEDKQSVRFEYPTELVEKILVEGEAFRHGEKPDLNCYRVYKLGLGAGLRAGEIGAARWSWISGNDKDGYKLTVQATSTYSGPKSKRKRTIGLATSVVHALREIRTVIDLQGEDYILEGSMTERTDKAFRRFSAWFAKLGWKGRLKSHTLRKIAGSLVCESHGIKAGQSFLGHQDVSTTADRYAAPTETPCVDVFGS